MTEAYARLQQQSDKYIEDAFAAATAKLFYDNPLNLAIAYILLLVRLTDPPDGAFKYMISLTLILFVYLYPLVRELILHWSRSIFASILSKDDRNMFVRHGIHHHLKCRTMPTLYARAFATEDDHIKDSFSWDTDVIPFVIDKYETDTIISHGKLFTGPLIPTSMNLETA